MQLVGDGEEYSRPHTLLGDDRYFIQVPLVRTSMGTSTRLGQPLTPPSESAEHEA